MNRRVPTNRRLPARPALSALSAVCAVCGGLLLVTACGGEPTGPSAQRRPGLPTPTSPVPGTGEMAQPEGAAPAPPAPAARRWRPKPGTAWQWQLTTPVDQRVDVPVYDIDGEDNSAAVVRSLHAKGRKVICYVNVGAAESFRPDYGSFPAAVLGKPNGWPGERWLDIRRTDVLAPIMAKRFEVCRRKGFDAVEPDLVDGYTNQTGFPLTAAHQLAYNRLIARLAHARGLSVGLKNDVEQAARLVGDFDFAVNEQCAEYRECERLVPFVRAGKAVFHVEYRLRNSQFCAQAKRLRFSSMRKKLTLDATRWAC